VELGKRVKRGEISFREGGIREVCEEVLNQEATSGGGPGYLQKEDPKVGGNDWNKF